MKRVSGALIHQADRVPQFARPQAQIEAQADLTQVLYIADETLLQAPPRLGVGPVQHLLPHALDAIMALKALDIGAETLRPRPASDHRPSHWIVVGLAQTGDKLGLRNALLSGDIDFHIDRPGHASSFSRRQVIAH